MSHVPKYIKVNGVMTKNPAFSDGSASQTTLMPGALVPVTRIQDIARQNEILDPTQRIVLSQSTEQAIDIMQSPDMESKYRATAGSGSLIDGLGEIFDKWEISIGLMNKFIELSECNLVFLVDDSGSMKEEDSINMLGQKCSRWHELRDRLIEMVEILSLVPNLGIQLCFLNRPDNIKFDYREHTPESFKKNFTDAVHRIFSTPPSKRTPMLRPLQEIFRVAETRPSRTILYLMTDGLPDEGTETISQLLLSRNAYKIPISLISCSTMR